MARPTGLGVACALAVFIAVGRGLLSCGILVARAAAGRCARQISAGSDQTSSQNNPLDVQLGAAGTTVGITAAWAANNLPSASDMPW